MKQINRIFAFKSKAEAFSIDVSPMVEKAQGEEKIMEGYKLTSNLISF